MITITNLNQISSTELKKIIEDNRISIKESNNTYYKITCPNCNKPEAFIYFNHKSRTIECNRKKNCAFNKELWEYIAENKNYSNKDMIQYINQILGYGFKDFYNQQTNSYNNTNTINSHIVSNEIIVNKNIITYTQKEKEQKFFKDCHKIFINCLNDQNNKQVIFSLKYLKKDRGYNDKQIKNFKLGFFPDKNKFISLLTDIGYYKNKIEELIIKYFSYILNYHKEEEHKNRITFSWFDTEDNIIGFSVRKPTTNDEVKSKYLNNNKLNKTDYLFNFSKNIIDKDIVIVEGQFDALSATYFALQQQELSNYHFVAIGGSNISETQINFLKTTGYTKIIIFLDNDNAGKVGAQKSANKLLDYGIIPYIATIPDNYESKDIDELIKNHKNTINLKFILDNAVKHEINTNFNNIFEENSTTNSNNTKKTENLDYELQELLAQIKNDQIDKKTKKRIVLDIFNYSKKIKDLKIKLIGNNIGINKKTDPKFISLNSLYSDIREYNNLLLSDDTENKSYTCEQFLYDIKNSTNCLTTGFVSLDKYISIQPSSLVFIAGRPSHGKTTLMLNILKNMIENNPDKSFLFYSYEETKSDVLLKIILSITNDSELNKRLEDQGVKGINLIQRVLSQFKDYAKCKKFTLEPVLEVAYNKVNDWIQTGRLEILTPKSSAESLSVAIIERCISSNIEKNHNEQEYNETTSKKNVAAVFIDYIQKLNTEEDKVSRQQEIQKICQTLLSTALDKRVQTSIILGAQVNRNVISLDTLTLDNMREAGDIEQDANLVIGIWNEQAGETDWLLTKKSEIEERKKNEELGLNKLISRKNNVSESSLLDIRNAINNITHKIEETKSNSFHTLKIKILKNRNGENNKLFELKGNLDRYFIEDKIPNQSYVEQIIKNLKN